MDKKLINILIFGAGAIGCHLAYIFHIPNVKVYIYMREEKFRLAKSKGIDLLIKDNEKLIKKYKLRDSEDLKFINKMNKKLDFDYVFFTHKLIGDYKNPFRKVSNYISDKTYIITPCTLLPGWWLKRFGTQKKTFFKKNIIAMTMWISGIMEGNQVTIKHTQRGYPIKSVYSNAIIASERLRKLIKKKSISPTIKDAYSEIYLKVVNSFAFNLIAIKYELDNFGLSKNLKAISDIRKIMGEIDGLILKLDLKLSQSIDSRISQTLSSTKHTMSMLSDFRMNKQVELFNQWKSLRKIKGFKKNKIMFTYKIFQEVRKKIDDNSF